MALLAWGKVKPEQLLATTVLLQLLNDTPEPPSDNFMSDATLVNEALSGRVLSLQREKELAEVLAFLAASTDDPAKVVALCVEERQKEKSMIVRLAVNNGGLQEVRRGFQEISNVLEKIATQGSKNIKDDEMNLLQKVVSLHHNRILCRLRSKHAKLNCNFKRQKQLRPKLLPLLYNALTMVSDSGISTISPTAFADLKSDVQMLQTVFNQLEAMTKYQALSESGLGILIKIVVIAQRLHARNLVELLLRSSALDPSARTNIIRTVTKLGRYDKASSFLIQAAKELSIFSNIEISVVKLPAPPVASLVKPQNLTLDMIYTLFDASEVHNIADSVQSRFGRKGISVPEIESRLSNILSTKFVVHAEIQLLIYYEIYNVACPPRVICSTKKACFLCNLFIKMHGKFKVPSTHGKLYEKWTFPDAMKEISEVRAKQIGTVVDSFSNALKDELWREVLDARKPYPAPFESTVFGSAIWVPLESSYPVTPRPSADSGLSRRHISNISASAVVQEPTTSRCSSLKASPVYHPLTQGDPLLKEILPNEGLLRFGTPQIHLTLSYEKSKECQDQLCNSQKTQRSGRLWVKVKWLPIDESPEPSRIVINLENFAKGSQEILDQFAENCEFLIRRRMEVISIRTSNKPFI